MTVSTSGVFGSIDIDGSSNLVDTWYLVDTVAAGKLAVANIVVVNRAATAAKIRCAVEVGAATGTPTDDEYVGYDCIIPSGGVWESYPRTLGAGDSLLFRSDTAAVNLIAFAMVEVA